MAAGMVDAAVLGNISVMLGLPLWWAYPFAVASFLLLAAVCALAAGHDERGRR
jgi:protein-S-isoprenylcysteine O-methyltransferase Ste14